MAEYDVQEAVRIDSMILTIRGLRVMLDADLAKIYGVTTSAVNQALKRNAERFPNDFAFQLTNDELESLMSQTVTSKKGRGGSRKLPRVFTEDGAIMLASVLNSRVAIEASIRVVRAFVGMREQLASHKELSRKLTELEKRVSGHDEPIGNLLAVTMQLGGKWVRRRFLRKARSEARAYPPWICKRRTTKSLRKKIEQPRPSQLHGCGLEAIRQLVEPVLPENRREIGFMREGITPYRIRRNHRN